MAIAFTPLGFLKPDGNELVRNGDNAIAANAQTADSALTSAQAIMASTQAGLASTTVRVDAAEATIAETQDTLTTTQATLSETLGRVGQVEVNIQSGLGDGPGLLEDVMHPGTYFITNTTLIQPDPANPGFYLIGA